MPQAPRRILVFPCGSEIGLEIHRSLRYSTHFELIGASSVDDHGRFVYDTYCGGLPFYDAPDFAEHMDALLHEQRIDAIYPAMDAVADALQRLAPLRGWRVIGSSPEATAICASKKATYALLGNKVPLAQSYGSIEDADYPMFIKPDRGYGGRNCHKALTIASAQQFLAGQDMSAMLLLEYLPGLEWTVDCFSDRHGQLRFHAARGRDRISNGISVRTSPSDAFSAQFREWAQTINEALRPRGAWFFQARQAADGQPRLLEVATRLGGSSGLFRCLGVNFAMLSAFDAFDLDVSVSPNAYALEMDRALDNRYRLDIRYEHIFVDLDDCLIVRGRVNHQLVAFLFRSIDDGKKLTLITRHARAPAETLHRYRLSELFDRVIHLRAGEKKSAYIDDSSSIFIDDSFAERQDVSRIAGIPVFAPDMLEGLLQPW